MLRSGLAELDAKAAEEDSAIAVLESTIGHLEENMRQVKAELAETEQRTGGYAAQAAEQEAQAAELETQAAALGEQLTQMLAQAQAAAEKAGGASTEAEALRSREAIAAAAAADAKAEAAAIRAENQQIETRRLAAEADKAAAEKQLAEKETEAKANRRALEDARDEAEAAANIISGHTLRMKEREKKAAAAADERVKLTMDTGALDSRIRLLTEMEKDYEGFNKAVKLVCQAKGELRVASLMKTESRYSLAIEIALGAGLQNIVVDREEDAKSAIAFLKRRDGGRATFLPLTAIHGEELRENGVEREFGFVGVASRLVCFDPKYTQIFNNLLGRTVIAEDLDCGIAMARKYRNAFRIVTLDGQVINRGGSMTGGSVSRSAGVLSRTAELERLNSRIGELHQRLEDAKVAEAAAGRELEAARYELTTAEAQRRAAEDEVLRLEGVQNQFQMLLSGLRESVESLTGELTAIDERLRANAECAAGAEKTIAEREAEAAALRESAERVLSGQSELLAESGRLAENVTACKTELASLNANREGILRRAADLRQLAEDLSGDREQKEAALKRYREQIETAQADIRQRTDAQTVLRAQGEDARQCLQTISQEKIALEAERTAKTRAGQEMNETLLNLERAASRLESKLATSAMEEKQILDKLWETYELSHSDAAAQRIELESVQKASRRVAELKREINGLGTINIGAIEEFERVNGRYTYLTDQRNDVEKAKGELTGIIREITTQMMDIFGRQFKLLSESFETTFTELFGGGQAKLELEDPENILECGIEIKAQPPGKTLKTISLLSGGEKAFVAIALYFAILKVHPTPFCIMDEIEAALDEANVVRTARYMRTLADKTQFIVITHRRGTMEGADVLYGVTMQEQGVSKILTINLNDMAKELKIK